MSQQLSLIGADFHAAVPALEDGNAAFCGRQSGWRWDANGKFFRAATIL